jgi:hypothetical protein
MMTPLEINRVGYKALIDALGFDDTSGFCDSLSQDRATILKSDING